MLRLNLFPSVGSAVAGLILLGASSATLAQTAFPEDIRNKLGELTAEQRAFLESDSVLQILPGREKLYQALRMKPAEQIPAYVDDMMAVIRAFAFDPDSDMAEIPLNPEATVFNRLVKTPEALWTIRRDPGPFSVHRYVRPVGGVPTFAGAPVALTLDDLRVGKVDVAIAGIPQSMSSGWRDGRSAPQALRAMHGIADKNIYTMVDPGAILNIVDYGDIGVDRMSLELSVNHVTESVQDIAATGAVPFLVGGDHSIVYSTVKAVHQAHDGAALTVVHFGAHYNALPSSAHTISDQTAIHRLIQENIISGDNLVQVGLRGPQAGEAAFSWMRENGVKYHTMVEVEKEGWDSVMRRVIAEVKTAANPIYISLDVSVMNMAEMTATARPVPGGLSVREMLPILRRLCAENEVAGFDIVDFAPMLDISYVSALNANYLMNACLSGMALRKQGIHSEDYLSPLALDHGQG